VSTRRFLGWLLLVALLAFAGRVVYIVAVTQHQEVPSSLGASVGARRSFDELYYEQQAIQIADGVWFKQPSFLSGPGAESAHHPPLTALVLAPVAWATSGSALAMRLTMAGLGVGVVALVGLIGREVRSERAGLFAAVLAAVSPNLWMNDGLIMSETLAALGTAAVIFSGYRLVRSPTWTTAIVAGVASGLAMLSRSEVGLMLPLVVIPTALLLRGVSWRLRVLLAGVALAAAAATVAPWVVYNLSRFDRPVLLSHGDGGVLLGANCDSTYSGPLIGFWNGLCGAVDQPLEPSVESATNRAAAFRYIGDHLDRAPIVAAARLGRIWGVYRPFQMADIAQAEGRPVLASRIGVGVSWVLVPLACWGAVILRRHRTLLVPLAAPFVIVSLAAVAFYGLLRFRVPAEVSLVVLAAVALDALAGSAVAGRDRRALVAGMSSA